MMKPATENGVGGYETKDVPSEALTKQEYFYPDHKINIIASSQQEADEALANKLGGATL